MKQLLLLTLIFVFCNASHGQKDPLLEELGISTEGNSASANVESIEKLNVIIKDSAYSNAKKAAKYARISYDLAIKIEYGKGQVDALMNLSRSMLYDNQLDSAMLFSEKAIDVANRLKDDELVVKATGLKGSVHMYQGDYDKAADTYFEAIKLGEKVNEELIISCYANLGHLFKMVDNSEKSKKYSLDGYRLGKKYNDTAVMITALNILGLLEKRAEQYPEAITYFEEGLGYARETGNLERQSQILYNMANIYFTLKQYDQGFIYYDESMEIGKKNNSYTMTAIGFHGGAYTYYEIGELNKAKQYADSALQYGLLSNNYEVIMETYALQALIAKSEGRYKKGFALLEMAYDYKDSLNQTELSVAAIESEDLFNEEKKRISDSLERLSVNLQIEHDKKINDEKVRAREVLLWISAFILIIISIGIYLLLKNNRLIKAQNVLVNRQKTEIESQHKEIRDSINYAKRIQDAIISKKNEWEKISPEHFILFKPKDVVSGDFYWAYHDEKNNRSIWAVADCTGHGVPGAFMSMLGIGFLNEIIIENHIADPGAILDYLRDKIISALTQENVKTKDGMDISLCVWDRKNSTLEYAGANNPLWLIRKGELKNAEIIKSTSNIANSELSLYEVSGDKMPIGYFLSVPPPFTTQTLDLHAGDVIITITDGFADQFGGEHGKKFKYKPLKELLLQLQSSSVDEQSAKLNETFEEWRQDEEQIDDVCIVAVKVL